MTGLNLFQFQTPAVRQLAWLTQAPQLISDVKVFDLQPCLPDDYVTILQTWDKHPDKRPDILDTAPHYRLGYYLETLYECLIRDLMGWTVLARNLPIRTGGQTLGELDFLIHNPHTGSVEHHEIAIKFYLGYGGGSDLPPGWYGPNPRDRLDIKTARMLGQQIQRGLLPETSEVLAALDIKRPEISRVFMPGYLFYPVPPVREATSSVIQTVASTRAAQTPLSTRLDGVPVNHLRGRWMYLNDMAETNTNNWIPLKKPHWLGPWMQPQIPDNTETTNALTDIKNTQTPRLFAILQHDNKSSLWKETDRVFVVPSHWPDIF